MRSIVFFDSNRVARHEFLPRRSIGFFRLPRESVGERKTRQNGVVSVNGCTAPDGPVPFDPFYFVRKSDGTIWTVPASFGSPD